MTPDSHKEIMTSDDGSGDPVQGPAFWQFPLFKNLRLTIRFTEIRFLGIAVLSKEYFFIDVMNRIMAQDIASVI